MGRARAAGGFTVIEMLTASLVVAVLVAIGVGSYVGVRGRAERSAAAASVRAAVPAISSYFVDNGTYAGLTPAELHAREPALDPGTYSFGSPGNLTASDYCVESTVRGETYRKAGPAGDIVSGSCP